MLIVGRSDVSVISILAKCTSTGQNESLNSETAICNTVGSDYLWLRYNIRMIIKCHN